MPRLIVALFGILAAESASPTVSIPNEEYFAYNIGPDCAAADVRPLAGSTLPSNWSELIGQSESNRYAYVEGERRQVRLTEIRLYRADTDQRLLTCTIGYDGTVYDATVSRTSTTRRSVQSTKLDADGISELGTFTCAHYGRHKDPSDTCLDREPSAQGRHSPSARDSDEECFIGVATLLADGSLALQLRASSGGVVGHSEVIYAPSDPEYSAVQAHFGDVQPDQSVPVRCFPDLDE